jgi:hypothetical protein
VMASNDSRHIIQLEGVGSQRTILHACGYAK